MTTNETKKPATIPAPFNKFAYGAFVILGLFHLIAKGSVSEGLMCLGIALVFDPFRQDVRWNDRPMYQKVWLIIHLIVTLVLFAIMMLTPVIK